MIIGDKRDEVIRNIQRAAAVGEFYAKVEPNDPRLTAEQSADISRRYIAGRRKLLFKLKTLSARHFANIAGGILNRSTEIVGEENLAGISGGAIITSNHFSPIDNTVIRKLTRKLHKNRINIVSQVSNFAMKGPIGFLMNYADTIPLTDDFRYMSHELTDILASLCKNNEFVLIYPEKEMWFNYRKPRPGLRGAYYFAAKLNVPVISCFIEMRDREEKDAEDFYKVKYTLHILPTLYPDPGKSVRENSMELCRLDYEQKKAAYEKVYGKALEYDFEPGDIAGWIKR